MEWYKKNEPKKTCLHVDWPCRTQKHENSNFEIHMGALMGIIATNKLDRKKLGLLDTTKLTCVS
jgi:cytochrome bd-type quinol oxidase subunit 1